MMEVERVLADEARKRTASASEEEEPRKTRGASQAMERAFRQL